jgi:hypothetical protein
MRRESRGFIAQQSCSQSNRCLITSSCAASDGLAALGKVAIDKSTWTYVWDFEADGKPMKWRLALFDMSPAADKWKTEISSAGGPWTLSGEGKHERAKRSAACRSASMALSTYPLCAGKCIRFTRDWNRGLERRKSKPGKAFSKTRLLSRSSNAFS